MHRIIQGDCRDTLKQLTDCSVQCCVTSPPYWGLRDYGMDGQIGLEEKPEDYIETLVDVFREVRRILSDDGTLWLNLGDTYNSNTHSGRDSNRWPMQQRNDHTPDRKPLCQVLKPKDLCGIPWRVAFALQADGWYLRQDIIWHKPNPMPESVTDRCTKAHEYIFLLSKSPKYYYNHEAIKEPATCAGQMRGGSTQRYEQNKAGMDCKKYATRNKRSVWSTKPVSFKGAHFAVFPPELITPCILAGCPEGGTVLDPFSGSGTTAEVAIKAGCKAISCEINPEYIDMENQRLAFTEQTSFLMS